MINQFSAALPASRFYAMSTYYWDFAVFLNMQTQSIGTITSWIDRHCRGLSQLPTIYPRLGLNHDISARTAMHVEIKLYPCISDLKKFSQFGAAVGPCHSEHVYKYVCERRALLFRQIIHRLKSLNQTFKICHVEGKRTSLIKS